MLVKLCVVQGLSLIHILNPDYYQKHLEPFEKTGCYRIQRTDPMLPDDQYGGVLGHNSGLFVTSGEDMMKVLKEADGDVSKLEKIFGMDEGDWGKNPVIIQMCIRDRVKTAYGI